MCTQQTLWLERLCKRHLYVRCTRLHIGDGEGDCLEVCVWRRSAGRGVCALSRIVSQDAGGSFASKCITSIAASGRSFLEPLSIPPSPIILSDCESVLGVRLVVKSKGSEPKQNLKQISKLSILYLTHCVCGRSVWGRGQPKHIPLSSLVRGGRRSGRRDTRFNLRGQLCGGFPPRRTRRTR
jgi:hypothetical protein